MSLILETNQAVDDATRNDNPRLQLVEGVRGGAPGAYDP
jgi:hypothetical protein